MCVRSHNLETARRLLGRIVDAHNNFLWSYKLLLRLSTRAVRRTAYADGIFLMSFRAIARESSVAKYKIFHNCACGAISLLAQAENITCAKRKYNCAQAQYHRFFWGRVGHPHPNKIYKSHIFDCRVIRTQFVVPRKNCQNRIEI